MISGKTKMYAILGKPIAQALSPIVFNAMFEHLGEDAVFLGFDVEPDNLEAAVAGLRALKCSGFVVTMPFKIDIIPLLDRIDEQALRFGAVNLVKVDSDGSLVGHNTDGEGLVRAINAKGVELAKKPVLLIGAGGVARSIGFSLLEAGIEELVVCNIDEAEAQDMIEGLHSCGHANIRFIPFDETAVASEILATPIIINATSLGMHGMPNTHLSLIPWEKLDGVRLFADVVLDPPITSFLGEAIARSFITVGGRDMFVQQALCAFKILFGKEGLEHVMHQATHTWLANKGGKGEMQ